MSAVFLALSLPAPADAPPPPESPPAAVADAAAPAGDDAAVPPDAPPAPAAAPPAPADAPPDDELLRDDSGKPTVVRRGEIAILVLKPTAVDLDEAAVRAISTLITAELSKKPDLDVISTADVKRLIALEADRQELGTCDQASCAAELAGALGARLVLFGTVGKLGTAYVADLTLFDSQKARALGRVSSEAKDLDELRTKIPENTRALIEPFLLEHRRPRAKAYKKHVQDDMDNKTHPVIARAAEDEERQGVVLATNLWRWGLVGAGGTLALAGVGYDVLSPTSGDDRLDGFDAIGPGLVLAGAGVALVGVLLNPFDPDEPQEVAVR